MQSPATLEQELRLDFVSIVPEFVRTAGHGTVIVLLGNGPSQDTILGDPDRPVESNVDAIVKYINCRFWDINDIEVTVDAVMSSEKSRWPRADAPKSGGGRPGTWTTFRPLGMLKSTIDRETENSRLLHSGTVPLAHGLVQADWYLREGEPLPSTRAQSKGFVASLYRGEIYGLSDHAATMRSFGIGAIRHNAFLVLRPREASDGQDGVYPDTSRTGLKFGGEAGGVDLPMSDWAQEFASNLPEPIIEAIKRSFTAKVGEFVDNEWKVRLQERYGLKWRIPKLLATPRGAELTTPIQPTGQSARKRRRTLLSRIFPEKTLPAGNPRLGDREREGEAADEKQVSGGLPDFRIVGEAEIGDNGRWAIASYSPPNNVDRSGLVLINRDHRIIAHHVSEVAKRYPSHLEDVVREELLKVYGEVAVAHVAHSEQMRKLTSGTRIDTVMRSDESLTMALLGLWQIETILMPRLQGKLQKGKGRGSDTVDPQ